MKLAELKSQISLEQERILSHEKTIYELSNKILASGVPEGISVEAEKQETEKAIANLKVEYAEKQSLFETSKEALARIENDYKISESILKSKTDEIDELNAKIDALSVKRDGMFNDKERFDNAINELDRSVFELKNQIEQNAIQRFQEQIRHAKEEALLEKVKSGGTIDFKDEILPFLKTILVRIDKGNCSSGVSNILFNSKCLESISPK